MATHHRVCRLERSLGALPNGKRRCSHCKDGTQPTGTVINMLGVRQNPPPKPCPGCGRDEPMIINFWAAEDPRRVPPSPP